MKFNFISICTYLCGVCPIYCSLSNYYGTQWVREPFCTWILFLGTMEMHWMLSSFIRKVFSPCDYRSQAMMINELYLLHHQCISVTSIYPMHTFLVSTLCRLLLGMKCFYVQLLWFWLLFFHLVYLCDICVEFAKNLSFN